MQVQAQHGEMEVTSEKDQTLTSTTRKIRFNGKQEVLLTAGGAYVRIKDGNIELHCPGILSVHAGSRNLSGPDRLDVAYPQFPRNELETKKRFSFSS